MAEKWNVEICVEHITQLKIPKVFENMGNGNGKMSQLGQRIKQAASQIRTPRQES